MQPAPYFRRTQSICRVPMRGCVARWCTEACGGGFMSVTKIFSVRANVADARALSRLLHEVPDADEIREQLCRPFFARRWHQSTQRSFWITSDGNTAVCLTLTGLDVD